MKPSDWLDANIHPLLIYEESKLVEMAAVGIKYDDGLFTSVIPDGTKEAPYSTFSRHASVRTLTPRQVISLGGTLSQDAHGERYVMGYDIAAAVWSLLRPITVNGSPSDSTSDNVKKMRLDLVALRGYGY